MIVSMFIVLLSSCAYANYHMYLIKEKGMRNDEIKEIWKNE